MLTIQNTTLYLSIALAGIVLFYLLTFPQFRQGTVKTIRLPKSVINKTKRSAKNDKNEILIKLDYNQTSRNPIKRIVKRGDNGSVSPGLFNREEIIIHTHPKVREKDKITNTYETILRERPSLADLKFSKRSGKEFLVTPSGKLIEFDAEQADLSQIKNVESESQLKASKMIFPDSVKSAEQSAILANQIFIEKTKEVGVKYKEINTKKEVNVKTKVK